MAAKDKEKAKPSSKTSAAPILLSKEFITASDDSEPAEESQDEPDASSDESERAESQADPEGNDTEALLDLVAQIPQEVSEFSTASDIRPAPPYIPPTGFYSLSVPKSSNALAKQFKGKQLWHLALPAGTPMEKLEGVSWDKLVKGEATIEDGTSHYNLAFVDDDQNRDLQIMAPNGPGYKPVGTRIQKSLFMKQFNKLEYVHVDIPKNKPGHIQPKGLRMRYKTTGSGVDYDGGALGDSDSDVPPRPQKKLKMGEETKRKRKEEEKSVLVDLSLQSKKAKHSSSKNKESTEAASKSKKESSSGHEKKEKRDKDKKKDKKSSDDRKEKVVETKQEKPEKLVDSKKEKVKDTSDPKEKKEKRDKDRDKEKRKKDHKEKKDKIKT
jgi:hypothetical protein